MKFFKLLAFTIIVTNPIVSTSEEYSSPGFELIDREEIEIDTNANDDQAFSSDVYKERKPSSKKWQGSSDKIEHWKIQEIIDRYDAH